jgi:UDP-N-acetylglucosamine/UDP-N-acetylgalactosamine diphosphorylase
MTQAELRARLARYDQTHLLTFWDALSPPQQQSLAEQIAAIDLELIGKLYRGDVRPVDWADLASRAEPPPAFQLGSSANRFLPDDARQRGEAALAAGEVGAILVAGGQGTRLGFDHPKGMFPIGPISNVPLFQILLEKILARSRWAAAAIPLYLMTSPATDGPTREFLAEHHYFGLPPEDVRIFCQGTMPAVDAASGHLLLAEKHRLSLSPDGHGGTLAALDCSGALADMKRRGLRHLCYFQVDNPLVPACDPELLGYHLLAQSEMSTLVVRKRNLRDKVGNAVMIDGRMQVLEYSDINPLPDEILDRRAADGSPVFWAGSLAIHVFDVGFLAREASRADALPFHVAHKAVPHIEPHGNDAEPQGNRIEPAKPNAYKFERFIFDLLPGARNPIVVEDDAQTVFAPLKNASGEASDTPETVRMQMAALYRRWLRAAGCRVDEATLIEISPLFAQNEQEVREKVAPGTEISAPRYFC